MENIEVKDVISAMTLKDYVVFRDDSKSYNLNIVGVRSSNPEVNKFNDVLLCFWKYEGGWNKIQMQCTTLPGSYWLVHPMNPLGTAILVPGQYRSVYKLDKHRGKYLALCQRLGDVTVYRDSNRDQNWDMDPSTERTGKYGINIHRAHDSYETELVNKYSAGCQVIQDPDEYKIFIDIVKKSVESWGNSFTYTLLDEADLS